LPDYLIKSLTVLIIPASVLRPLSDDEMNAYRTPFLKEADRKPILVWPNEIPIGGEPARNVKVLNTAFEWLSTSVQPKLVLYASPGMLFPQPAIDWIAKNYANVQTRYVGAGLHYIQEDQPESIGRNLSDWLRGTVD
jgi:haloalkane dehalogenase